MQIKFQTALITGSSRGLGRQIALKLAAEGVRKIAIHYRTGRSDAETTLSLIESAGASGVLVQGDVADPVAAESLVKEAAQKLGGCDIFVHSVCPPLGEIYEHVMATELSVEKWQLAFDTQARAFFIGARTAAKFMRGARDPVFAVLPSVSNPDTNKLHGKPNKLFFGYFSHIDEAEWTNSILDELHADETVFRTMLHDIYQNGQVLQNKKYRYLAMAYKIFMVGLTATVLTFIGQHLLGL